MEIKNKKIILFDVYQTLIDIDINKENKKANKAKAMDNFAKSLKQYNIDITPIKLAGLVDKNKANFYAEKDKKIYHHNFCDIISQVLKNDLDTELSQEKICSLIYEYHKIYRGHSYLYSGVAETLAILEKKYILVVASYTQKCFTKFELKELGIDKFFSHFIYSSDIGLRKTSPKFYEHCLKIVGEKAENCVMIGDNYDVDVLVPQKMGIKTIWVKNPLSAPQYAHLIDKEPKNMINLDDFNKLPKIIKQIFEK